MSLASALLTMALLISAQEPVQQTSRDPQVAGGQDTPVALPDVVVDGRPLEELVSDFVAEMAAPARGRGLARWQGRVCVGVVNLRAEAAQMLVDRISEVMQTLGLEPGSPGCRANAIIIFTTDGRGLAARLADEHRRAFRAGMPGLDRGNVALETFVSSERPIRWWHTSLPVDADTGRRAIRMPGDFDSFGNPASPIIRVLPSRLNSQIRDDLTKVMVIVDIDGVQDVGSRRLADYLAVVSLAQIDPEGRIGGHDSVLAIFDNPAAAPDGLTDWDRSYLESLYDVLDDPQRRSNPNAVTGAVADVMTRDRRAAQAEAEAED